MNKKVLVTGASGHLGGMLFNSLSNLGYKNLVGTDLKKKNNFRICYAQRY